MTLRLQEVVIENVNRYPDPVVGRLRDALRTGAEVVPDPKRTTFYEVIGEEENFYIDVPGNGPQVILLGAWSSRHLPN